MFVQSTLAASRAAEDAWRGLGERVVAPTAARLGARGNISAVCYLYDLLLRRCPCELLRFCWAQFLILVHRFTPPAGVEVTWPELPAVAGARAAVKRMLPRHLQLYL